MKKTLILFMVIGINLLPVFLNGQENEAVINSIVDGKIVDSARKIPLEGATIQIKNTTNTSTTNGKGEFNIRTAQRLPFTLIITYVGYRSREVVATSSTIEVQLQQDEGKLDEVVVVGYGTQRKKDITGSISSVPKENFNQVTPSVDNILRGAAPGVVVTQSSGQPGASTSVRIRGGNSITGGNEPLYVIDGVLVYNDNNNGSTGISLSGAGVNVLATINPADIESIDILKDASATAIYGSRGANGVIIINTKKGAKGQNTVNYQGYYGVQQVAKKLDLLGASEWARLHNDIQIGIGQTPSFSSQQLDSLKTAGYDWQSAAFRDAEIQDHQISISGGDERSRYSVSGNYFSQEGVIIGSDFKRYAARINYERNISTAFKIGINATGSTSVLNGLGILSSAAALNSPNALVGVLQQAPVISIYNNEGGYNITNNPYVAAINGYVTNPIADLKNTTNETKINRVLGSFYGEYRIFKDLVARVSAGTDIINTKQNYYAPSKTTNGFATKGLASIGVKSVDSWLNENTLNYTKSFGRAHQLSALAGYTIQSVQAEWSTAGAINFVNDLNTYNAIQDGTASKPSSGAYESVLRSWLGRVNYSFSQRYNFTFSIRADGSSRFGNEFRWGYFPSAGFSWNITEEKFAKDWRKVDNLKLRLSAGSTGNQEIGDYLALAPLGSVNYSFGNTIVTGFAPTRISNPDLKWEKTALYNAGLDVNLLNRRINITLDAYYKKTTDLLVNVPIPFGTGYTSALQNIGSVSNKGVELGINAGILNSSTFNWTANLVYSLNRNKVVEIGNNVQQFFPDISSQVLQLQQPVIVKVGLPLGTFWGYRTDGIFQENDPIASLPTIDGPVNTKPGDRRFKDISGPDGKPDGRITAAYDKVNLGNAQPKFVASLSNSISYKGFDLLLFLQGVYGNKIFNALKRQLEIPTLANNGLAVLSDHWTPQNPSNEIPRAANSPAIVISDRYIEDGSYLRFKVLTLGYTIPANIVSRIHVRKIRVYLSAQNLITWTKYSGYDPEVSTYEQSNIVPGVDFGAYPSAKTYVAGLSFTF